VSIGAPVLSIVGGVTAPQRTFSLSQEGQFASSPPAIDTAEFHLGSLSGSAFTWKAALSLALASKLAYESERNVMTTCIGSGKSWGFESCEFIDVDDTQCFVAKSSEIALVTFRGTESRGDWLRNVNVPGRTRDYGVVHRGFLGGYQAIESRLRTALADAEGRKLISTGHSLGGALATVMAAESLSFMSPSWTVTFGQPAVGRGAFQRFFRQHYSGKFYRFVNDDDIVPRIPPGYQHVGRLLHFDAQGNLQNNESLPITSENAVVESLRSESIAQGPSMLSEAEYEALKVQIGQDVVRMNRPLSESVARPQTEGLIPSVRDHSMDRYIAKITANSGS